MAGKPGNGATDGAAPSPAAQRMARYRNRRRKQLRCVTIELREAEIDVLIRRRWLDRDRRGDVRSIKEALYSFFDHYFGDA